MKPVHVEPVDDLREHVETKECWCGPRIIEQAGCPDVVVHNSLDGRERFENLPIQ